MVCNTIGEIPRGFESHLILQNYKKEGDLHMFLDKRNKNKVIIVRESSSNTVIVKDLKTGKRYLVDKENLIEIKIK